MDVRLAFQSFKLKNMLGTKDPLPLKSFVVYKFICARCNACYVGYTTRHLTTRIHEHLNDKQSHIHKHLRSNTACFEICDASCFTVVDSANTEYELKIREAIQIQWLRPTINKQIKSYKLSLNLLCRFNRGHRNGRVFFYRYSLRSTIYIYFLSHNN